MMKRGVNNGFVTALGLAYGHLWHMRDDKLRLFGLALDHIINMEYPNTDDYPDLQLVISRCKKLVSWAKSTYDQEKADGNDCDRLFNEIREILMSIDELEFGLGVEVQHW